ncbi:hypothetical protein PPYR_00250 [Photinus pyralis]|uniref:Methionine aminopeptidase n=1 Tax=Photinus pyralis TaxID=7054 RepID=A0A1Y1LLJ2_PHOPY|nr:methionine aminopeptidase 1D, mitochondrial [Photinus pyralis]KAB0803280.1 hypothetical protein PPYR_00250 [Photinus pyralis]
MRQFRYLRRFWPIKTDFGTYKIVTPGKISPPRSVPSHIAKPTYYESGTPPLPLLRPEIKKDNEIKKMRSSCKLAANVLDEIGRIIHVGQTTDELDAVIHELVIANGAYPSPLNYKHFPKSVCTSVNNVACHGIPDDRPLQDGDIVNVDITVFLDNYHGDCSKTFLIGQVDKKGCDLVEATQVCLEAAIEICKPGQSFSAIGAAIQKKARELKFSVVPAFIGHGIGSYFHGPPDIYHFRNNYPGVMDVGMTFTIEPVLSQGTGEIGVLEDNWTAITLDNSRTAQFEHTVLITPKGCEILTIPD